MIGSVNRVEKGIRNVRNAFGRFEGFTLTLPGAKKQSILWSRNYNGLIFGMIRQKPKK